MTCFLYDLLGEILGKAKRVVEDSLIVAHRGKGGLDGGLALASLWGKYDTDFANLGELVEDVGNGSVNAELMQLAAKEAAKREGEDAVKDMDLDLLISPVVLWPQADVHRIFHGPESGFDMMLTAVAMDDLGIGPIIIVCE